MTINTVELFKHGRPRQIIDWIFSSASELTDETIILTFKRALVLLEAMIPPLVWLRDNKNKDLSTFDPIEHFKLTNIIRISRDTTIPADFRKRPHAYLNSLPGYSDDCFNDDGSIKSDPDYGLILNQQHDYLLGRIVYLLSMSHAANDSHIFD